MPSLRVNHYPTTNVPPKARCAANVMGNLVIWTVLMLVGLTGCRTFHQQALTPLQKARRTAEIISYGAPSMVQVKPVRRTKRLNTVTKFFSSRPSLSLRTQQVVRRYNLTDRLVSDPEAVIQWFQELVKQSPHMEEVNALAEIAKREADWQEANGNNSQAMKLNATALLHAHQFLFDSNLDIKRNAYDPQFRHICDVYNSSLESITRRLAADGAVVNGTVISIGDGDIGFDMQIQFEGRWRDQEFDRFELVSDYQTEGIENHFHTYGLGVPLIAVLHKNEMPQTIEKYYPPSLTLPLTAFCEIQPADISAGQASFGSQRRTAILRLYDPLENTTAQSRGRSVPLESDITTPLAYHLKDPLLNGRVLSTATILDSSLADKIHGLYMLEPFDPSKIPVVMVHGLWSSPVTWAQMFNDLRAIPEIHSNYQFWFYSYSSGQPFVVSASEMRKDLNRIRRELDSGNDSQALDQMVVVGHSMGGLISRLQVINSGNDFWNLIGNGEFDSLKGNTETIQRLRDTVYFEANPAIKRIVTIATPHHGSQTSNATTRWLSGKIISLPELLAQDFQTLSLRNKDVLVNPSVLTGTSVDSLAPTSPVLLAMDAIPPQPQTTFHNIIGKVEKKNLSPFSRESQSLGSDGVVSVENAQFEHAQSLTVVPSEHSSVHLHPQCILEVRRVLLQHLVGQNRIRPRNIPPLPEAVSTGQKLFDERQKVVQLPFENQENFR